MRRGFVEIDDDGYEEAEPWRASLSSFDSPSFDESKTTADSAERHPALELAERFLLTVMDLSENDSTQNTFFSTVMRSATDMIGGLAQATGDPLEDRHCRALAISQLKRSLSGLAFARGALFGLRSDEAIDSETAKQLHEQLETILPMIHELTEQAWDEAEFS